MYCAHIDSQVSFGLYGKWQNGNQDSTEYKQLGVELKNQYQQSIAYKWDVWIVSNLILTAT